MKRKLFVFASAAVLLAMPAVAANRKIPPVPASSKMQIPPAPVTPAAPVAPAPAAAADKDNYTVAESRKYQSKGNNVQHFVDYINLKAGQEKLPLKLIFSNSGFTYISCSIAGYPVLDRKKIADANTLPINMTGNLGGGSSQVIIDATGPANSTLSWVITAPKPTLKAVKPGEAGPGDTIELSGTNFCPEAKWNEVTVGDKKAQVDKATANSLSIQVPEGLESGKQKVTVNVIGQKTKAVEISLIAIPEVSGVSLNSAPPGQEITVTGKNFSKTLSQNKVTIGGAACQVVSGDTTSLNVVIPVELDLNNNPAYGVPIFVEVGKLKSKESVTINVDTRVF